MLVYQGVYRYIISLRCRKWCGVGLIKHHHNSLRGICEQISHSHLKWPVFALTIQSTLKDLEATPITPQSVSHVSVREATPRAQPTTCVVPCQKPGTWNTLWVPSHLLHLEELWLGVSLSNFCVWTSHVWWLPINCFVKPRLWRISKPIMITIIVSNSNSSSSM